LAVLLTTDEVAMGMSIERFDDWCWLSEVCEEAEVVVVVCMVVVDERVEELNGFW
jgi:hypothetical protein